MRIDMEGVKMAKTTKQRATTSDEKRVNSFFAGIGGFDLAFSKHGFEPAFNCEKDDFCRSVLKKHWPNVAHAGDIQQLSAKDIPAAEVWTAGFPCQDLSLARTPHGKRSGLKGSQSGLFYTFLELLSVHKPKVVLLENVAGLLNSHKGADFNALISSLTQLGYGVAWRVLNARYFGAPQSRPRVFICAWHGSPSNAVTALFEEKISMKPKNERHGFLIESKCAETGISVPQVSFCISATSGRHTGLDWARSYVTYPKAVRRLTPLECEQLQGLPENWTLPDKDYVVPVRGIETNRYHAIGNAVCVPVVQWVAGRISNVLRAPENGTGGAKQAAIEARLQHLANTFLSPKSGVRALHADSKEPKWQSGGIAYKDWVVTAAVSSSPCTPMLSQLIDVIEKRMVHERYFLSANAAQGILRRVDKLGRNLFPPLDAVLRRIANPVPVQDEGPIEARENVIELMAL
jgi:DNA (cytosine-5)-methyltransferase 1